MRTRRLRRRVQRVSHLRGTCARPATHFLLVVGHPPEGGDGASCGDGQEPSSFAVRLGARLPFDKRPESWLDDTRSAGEKFEPRGGEGPQPMEAPLAEGDPGEPAMLAGTVRSDLFAAQRVVGDEAAMQRHGTLPLAGRREAFLAGMREVLLPGLAGFGVDTAAAARFLDELEASAGAISA